LYWNTGEKADTQEKVLTHLLETGPALDVLLLGECFVDLSADFLHKYGFAALVYHPAETELQAQLVYFRPQSGLQVTHLCADLEETATDQLVPGVSSAADYLQRTPRFLTRNVLLRVELNGEATLVSSVHLASRRGGFQDETSQMTVANRYKAFIVQGAGRPLSDFGQRIAVVGDFNMNPFDAPMLEPIGFYAPNNRDAVRVTREAQFVPELMFYNPCWSLLSDIDPLNEGQPRVCGTHYYPGAASKKLHWHLYDQVILSECLADRLVARELRIATFPALLAYVKSRKGEDKYSDHLPLCFTLNL
jgi:hypothetical protein